MSIVPSLNINPEIATIRLIETPFYLMTSIKEAVSYSGAGLITSNKFEDIRDASFLYYYHPTYKAGATSFEDITKFNQFRGYPYMDSRACIAVKTHTAHNVSTIGDTMTFTAVLKEGTTVIGTTSETMERTSYGFGSTGLSAAIDNSLGENMVGTRTGFPIPANLTSFYGYFFICIYVPNWRYDKGSVGPSLTISATRNGVPINISALSGHFGTIFTSNGVYNINDECVTYVKYATESTDRGASITKDYYSSDLFEVTNYSRSFSNVVSYTEVFSELY